MACVVGGRFQLTVLLANWARTAELVTASATNDAILNDLISRSIYQADDQISRPHTRPTCLRSPHRHYREPLSKSPVRDKPSVAAAFCSDTVPPNLVTHGKELIRA